jgi:dCTP deaminase
MKFKIKQRGLVNVSGFHVDPGYSGKLLFSVYNAGPRSIVLTRGEPVFVNAHRKQQHLRIENSNTC